MQAQMVLRPLLGLVVLFFSLPLLAKVVKSGPCKAATTADGVVLIDQAAVNAGGICGTSGRPGFPVTIDGSNGGGFTNFKLSSDLVVAGLTDGIDIVADNVTLDLNGFAIIGPVSCQINLVFGGFENRITGLTVSCSNPCPPNLECRYGGVGISSNNNNITVRNGKVQGFRGGINLNGENYIVYRVQALSNSDYGIWVITALVTESTANVNGFAGFRASASQLNGSTASNNGSMGFDVSDSNVTENVSTWNGGWGIVATSSLVGLNQMSGGNFSGSMNPLPVPVSAHNNNCDGILC